MRIWPVSLAVGRRRSVVAALLASVGALAALALAVAPSSRSAVRPIKSPPAAPHRVRLASPRAFRSCTSLVRYGRRYLALTRGVPETPLAPVAGTIGAPAAGGVGTPGGTAAPAPTAGAPAAGSSGGGSTSYSTTNNQEPGVDEPDTVKTDGSTIFAVSGNTLYAVSVTGARPQLVGSFDLGASGYGSQLLLRGTHLIVISGHGGIVPVYAGGGAPGVATPAATGSSGAVASPSLPASLPASPYYYGGQTTLTELDVSDPAAMKVDYAITVAGNFVDARQNGSTARVVISSPPPMLAQPALSGTAAGYVPRWQFHSMLSHRRFSRPVASCQQVAYPPQFSGLGMVTIFTINIDRGLSSATTDALMADAQIIYGSTSSLYLATERWINPSTAPYALPPQQLTQIDKFDATSPDSTTFIASGTVPGYLLNQFSMSEWGGFLRVASTSAPIWWGGTVPQVPSQSYVTVLATQGNQLTQVGQLSGLGTGQKIYSVRFVGNAGYVVTFRQVDPLYTLDLSDPTAPRVAGQLELQGYSSYLHPLGPGLLLGVGQDVGANNEPSGSQLELFDVSNPAAPRLVDRTSLGQGSSTQVNYDHHAFLYWPQTGLAVLPVQIYPTYAYTIPPIGPAPAPSTGTGSAGSGTGTTSTGTVAPGGASATQSFTGAIGFHIDSSGIQEVGQITHPSTNGYTPAITRSLVIGNVLYTLSDAGIMASSLDTLSPQAFVAFPNATTPPVFYGAPAAP